VNASVAGFANADPGHFADFKILPAADSRVLRKGRPRTPPGPEGSNGTGSNPVPQGCLAIIRRAVFSDKQMAATPSSHLVLARKWRPERFSELVGQEHVTRTLGQALKSGRIAHAFLFTGIRGVGQTTAARIMARCLNCQQGPTPEPCGTCAACVEIRTGSALDVVEIDGATYRKIDDARAIIENLSYRPARDRFKIYIIDEAHQLTDQAFNALLKTLEEPPAHVKFILATTEPQKMPETILSRLQRYDFRRIPFAVIFDRLKELASREGAGADEAALRMLAREAGGSMRDAERMLETAIASLDGKVTEVDVASIFWNYCEISRWRNCRIRAAPRVHSQIFRIRKPQS
jgi:DNA polymerase III subunit gamma/tau